MIGMLSDWDILLLLWDVSCLVKACLVTGMFSDWDLYLLGCLVIGTFSDWDV